MFVKIDHNIPTLERTEHNGVRYYKSLSGELYPSVTTVLSDYNDESLNEWRQRVGEKEASRVSNVAKVRGTAVHSLIERYLNNETLSDREIMGLMPNVKQPFNNIKRELSKITEVHCIEESLYSNDLKLAGTVDCIAVYKDKLSVIDFKTSRRLKKKEDIQSYFLQAAAYGYMFTERTGIPVEDLVIIIGVDGVNFAQVMSKKINDCIDELKERVYNYRKTAELDI